MPLYMDHHKNLEGLTAEAVAEDHKKDLEAQENHEAKALKYWLSEEKGEVFCLFEASSAEAAEAPYSPSFLEEFFSELSFRCGASSETHSVPLLILGNLICRGNTMRSGPELCTSARTTFRCTEFSETR
jgi:hypothetical protein